MLAALTLALLLAQGQPAASAPPTGGILWDGPELLEQFRRLKEAAKPADIPAPPAKSVPAPVPAVKAPTYPVAPATLFCEPVFIGAANKAWDDVFRGRGNFEVGFRIDVDEKGRYSVTFAPDGSQTRLRIDVVKGRTVAVVHTHPNSDYPEPSGMDVNMPIPNYVISSEGMYVTIPGAGRYKFVRQDWDQPCRWR